jgi:hypothetical protein
VRAGGRQPIGLKKLDVIGISALFELNYDAERSVKETLNSESK